MDDRGHVIYPQHGFSSPSVRTLRHMGTSDIHFGLVRSTRFKLALDVIQTPLPGKLPVLLLHRRDGQHLFEFGVHFHLFHRCASRLSRISAHTLRYLLHGMMTIVTQHRLTGRQSPDVRPSGHRQFCVPCHTFVPSTACR
jgi:hypothetical protein